jgi:hypothetical protein
VEADTRAQLHTPPLPFTPRRVLGGTQMIVWRQMGAPIATLHQGGRVFVNEGRVRNNRPPSPVDWQKVTSMNGYTGWIDGNYIAPER